MSGYPQGPYDPAQHQGPYAGSPSGHAPLPVNPYANANSEQARKQSWSRQQESGRPPAGFAPNSNVYRNGPPDSSFRAGNAHPQDLSRRPSSPTFSNSGSDHSNQPRHKPFRGNPIERGPAAAQRPTSSGGVQPPPRPRSPGTGANTSAMNSYKANGWGGTRINTNVSATAGPSSTAGEDPQSSYHAGSATKGHDESRSRGRSPAAAATATHHMNVRPEAIAPAGGPIPPSMAEMVAQVAHTVTAADSLGASDYMYEMISATNARQDAIKGLQQLESLLERCRGRPDIDVVARDIEANMAVHRAERLHQEGRMRAAQIGYEASTALARRRQMEYLVRSMVAEGIKSALAAQGARTGANGADTATAKAGQPPPQVHSPAPASVAETSHKREKEADVPPAAEPTPSDQANGKVDASNMAAPAKRRYVDVDSFMINIGRRVDELESKVEDGFETIDRIGIEVPPGKFAKVYTDVQKLKRAAAMSQRSSASVEAPTRQPEQQPPQQEQQQGGQQQEQPQPQQRQQEQ